MVERHGKSGARRRVLWDKVLAELGQVCECCGETGKVFLTLEHRRQNGAEHRRKMKTKEALLRDVIKAGIPREEYGILCMNCNFASYVEGECPHKAAKAAAA